MWNVLYQDLAGRHSALVRASDFNFNTIVGVPMSKLFEIDFELGIRLAKEKFGYEFDEKKWPSRRYVVLKAKDLKDWRGRDSIDFFSRQVLNATSAEFRRTGQKFLVPWMLTRDTPFARCFQKHVEDSKNASMSSELDNTLTIYLRGEKLWDPKKMSGWAWNAPPCSFYSRLVREHGYKRVVIVTSPDHNHACANTFLTSSTPSADQNLASMNERLASKNFTLTDYMRDPHWNLGFKGRLMQAGAVDVILHSSKHVADDFCALVGARNLVTTYSTFGDSAAIFAPWLKRLHARVRSCMGNSLLGTVMTRAGQECTVDRNLGPGVEVFLYQFQWNRTRFPNFFRKTIEQPDETFVVPHGEEEDPEDRKKRLESLLHQMSHSA